MNDRGGDERHPSVPATPMPATSTPGGDTDGVEPTPVPTTPQTPAAPTPTGLPRRTTTVRAQMTEVDEVQPPMPGDEMMSPGGSTTRARRVIWGTDVNVDNSFERLKNFLTSYSEDGAPSELPPLYLRVIERAHALEENVVNVNLQHIYAFDADLYSMLIHYPTELIGIFDLALQDVYRNMYNEEKKLEIRTFGPRDEQVVSLRELDPTLINRILGVRGMIIRCSQVVPDLYRGFYRCTRCMHTEVVDVERGRLDEPITCINCGQKGSFEMVHNRGLFNDKQLIKLQEAPESIPQGETPSTVTVIAYDSLVDSVKPGDRVEITGIFRAVPIRLNQRQRTVRNIFRTYFDLVHVSVLSADKEATDLEDDASREQRMREVAGSANLYERLARSVAPSIHGLDDVKKGVVLQLFGGTSKNFTGRVGGRSRSEVNCLLVGDPGTSKSQILRYVHELAPRGIYTSGSGSSAVGLTAFVTRDADTGDLVLESGALVLSDQGICCVDEFDKMPDYTRSVLHEAMEQQTISVAKAGIIATLNARTSLLAAANPINSRYDPKKTVVDNIQLPPTLLSRFDLIFLILDHADVETDRRLARHIVSLFYLSGPGQRPDSLAPLQHKLLVEYIAYARSRVKPVLSDAAADRLLELYVEMRKRGNQGVGGVRTVSATPRNLESLIRLSEARAKLDLRDSVEVSDVEEAHRLMVSAIAQVATDPTTGMLDMDLLNAGQSAHQRNRTKEVADLLWAILSNWESGGDIRVNALHARLQEDETAAVRDNEFRAALKSLEEQDKVVFTASRNAVRRVV